MVREIKDNNALTIPATSVSRLANSNGELEKSPVSPPPAYCIPTINVSDSGVVNVVGNIIENTYIVKKTAITLEDKRNKLTAADKLKTAFGDRKKRLYVAIIATICVLIPVIVLSVVLSQHRSSSGLCSYYWCINATFQYVTRDEWHAIVINENAVEPLKTNKPKLVIISHTAGSPACFNINACSNIVQSIQAAQISRGNVDIPFNFLVGGDGRVYEGRGWGKTGAHTEGFNNCSIGLAFIGNFINNRPTNVQVSVALELMELGAQNGFLQQNYVIFTQSQVSGLDSPGVELIEIIKTWTHWKPYDGNRTAVGC